MYETPELQNIDLKSFFDNFSSLVKGDLHLNKGIDFRVSFEQGAEFCYADPRPCSRYFLISAIMPRTLLREDLVPG